MRYLSISLFALVFAGLSGCGDDRHGEKHGCCQKAAAEGQTCVACASASSSATTAATPMKDCCAKAQAEGKECMMCKPKH